jgi:hypothetical protein
MIGRTILATVLSLWMGSASLAPSVKLQDYEIEALLSGNTAVGQWEGANYRQYFDPDGSTIFAQEGARSALGQWRVEGEEYQSVWPPREDWESWFVMEFAGDFYWVSKTTPPTLFEVLEGSQLVME